LCSLAGLRSAPLKSAQRSTASLRFALSRETGSCPEVLISQALKLGSTQISTPKPDVMRVVCHPLLLTTRAVFVSID
jgi:hypothetical protein